jgi:hypothetical protein
VNLRSFGSSVHLPRNARGFRAPISMSAFFSKLRSFPAYSTQFHFFAFLEFALMKRNVLSRSCTSRSSSISIQGCKSHLLAGLSGLLALLACPVVQAQVAQYIGIERTLDSVPGANLPSVAVDSNGVVYIADQNNGRVLKETPSGPTYTPTTAGPVGGWLSFTPVAVAVDQFFSVYIVDGANSRVLKETWSGSAYAERVAAGGLNNPIALALDGAQNSAGLWCVRSSTVIRQNEVRW